MRAGPDVYPPGLLITHSLIQISDCACVLSACMVPILGNAGEQAVQTVFHRWVEIHAVYGYFPGASSRDSLE